MLKIKVLLNTSFSRCRDAKNKTTLPTTPKVKTAETMRFFDGITSGIKLPLGLATVGLGTFALDEHFLRIEMDGKTDGFPDQSVII